jgi:hypothetical protein
VTGVLDHGLDYAWTKPDAGAVSRGGYRFVLRYLAPLPNGKVVTAAELRTLRARRLEVGLNWESAAGAALRGAAGRADAVEAVRQAKALGYPAGCTIYFSIDFDQNASQATACNAYLRAAQTVLHAAGYRAGVYGGYNAVRRAFDAGVVDDGWQTFAWSGGRWDARAAIRQVQNEVPVGGADCDINERLDSPATHLMGGAAHPASHPATDPANPVDPLEDGMLHIELTEIGEPHVFCNPARATGRKTWLLLGSDMGDGVVRVATHGDQPGSGWVVKHYDVHADADLVAAQLLDMSVAKVSVLLESGTGVFAVDAVGTPAAA